MSAYLKLDEASAGTAADSSGDGNLGTVTGATASSDVPTTAFPNSYSLSFDGDDYVEVADAAELDGPDITISFWVKLNDVSGVQTMVAKWDVNHWQQYVVQQDNGVLRFYTGDGSNVAADSLLSSETLVADTWYHIVASQTGTSRSISVMPEGGSATENSDTAGQAIGGSAIELTLGGKKLNAGSYFEFLDGNLDDMRVYSRGLTEDEITALHSGDHTVATWDGSDSVSYDTAANWDINAVPDPYTYVTIGYGTYTAQAVTDIAVAGLEIQSLLNLSGQDLTIHDSGTFSNAGTLQLRNSEVLTGFVNDTNSGTVLDRHYSLQWNITNQPLPVACVPALPYWACSEAVTQPVSATRAVGCHYSSSSSLGENMNNIISYSSRLQYSQIISC